MIYFGRPLAEVIEDVQRYSTHQIVLDGRAGELRFSGSVLQAEVEQWVRGLARIFPVEVLDCADSPPPATQQAVSSCAGHTGATLIRPQGNRG